MRSSTIAPVLALPLLATGAFSLPRPSDSTSSTPTERTAIATVKDSPDAIFSILPIDIPGSFPGFPSLSMPSSDPTSEHFAHPASHLRFLPYPGPAAAGPGPVVVSSNFPFPTPLRTDPSRILGFHPVVRAEEMNKRELRECSFWERLVDWGNDECLPDLKFRKFHQDFVEGVHDKAVDIEATKELQKGAAVEGEGLVERDLQQVIDGSDSHH